MKILSHFFSIALVITFLYLPLHSVAQCGAGQANITIRVYGDQYVDTESGITCTVNGSPVTLSPTSFAATSSTKWHVFTVPCMAVGGKIVVNLTDAFGDGISAGIAPNNNNVFVYVNNEMVDSLSFTNGFSASTASHNTNFTTNIGPNSTCATASANTVAVFAPGATVNSYSGVVAQNAAADHTGFAQLPGTTRTECGTFTATASTMDFFAYGGSQLLPSTANSSFGAVSMQVFNSSCTQVGTTLTTQGAFTSGLTVGQTYTFCGTRSLNESTDFPTSTAVLTNIALGVRPTNVLPLRLLEFYGVGSNTANYLHWKTANEQDLINYEVQQSSDGAVYKTIAGIKADNKNANEYSYTDVNFTKGNNFYRLKINDIMGKTSYSNIVSLYNKTAQLSIGSLSPNPAVNTISIPVNAPAQQVISYSIIDVQGKLVRKGNFNINNGSTVKTLDVSALPAGILLVRFYDATNKLVNTQKIIKQ